MKTHARTLFAAFCIFSRFASAADPSDPPLPTPWALSRNAEMIKEGQSILPPAALAKGSLTERKAHPLAAQMDAFLANQQAFGGFKPTGLTRQDYLKWIEGQVRCFMATQLPDGMVKDPVGGSSYATGGFAEAAAVLYASGYTKDPQVLESAMRGMDYSVNWLLKSVDTMQAVYRDEKKRPSIMTDFFIHPVMLALEQLEKVAPPARVAGWKEKLKQFQPVGYSRYGTSGNNWPVVHNGGEYLRALHGLTDMSYVEWIMQTQKKHMTSFGMFMEMGAPFAYDGFSRHFFTAMLHRGYHGAEFDYYRDACWKGAWTSLLDQSPFGELPAGFRSAHHIWNEGELAVVYEIYAAHYAKAGRMAEAGAFKRGARLALSSMQQWVRPDGSAYIVKNRFPIKGQPKAANPHSTYSLLATGMLATAYLYADESIPEKPAPADVGGFAFHIPEFNMVIANAGGAYCQYMTRGNHVHNPTGLIRVHLKGGNPQLGPSDGAIDKTMESGIHSLAIGPAWKETDGSETRLSEFPTADEFKPLETKPALPPQAAIEILKQTPQEVVFKASYDWKGKKVSETVTLNKQGVTVTDKVEGAEALRIYYPMLVNDGLEPTQVNLDGSSVTLRLRNAGIRFAMLEPKGGSLVRTGKKLISFNGEVEPAYIDLTGSEATFRISAELGNSR